MYIVKLKNFTDKHEVGTKIFLLLLFGLGIGIFFQGIYTLIRPRYITLGTINSVDCNSSNSCILDISYKHPTANEYVKKTINVYKTETFSVGENVNIFINKDNLENIYLYNRQEELFNSIIYIVVGIIILLGIIISWWKGL